jgi:hypothetical protein
MDRLSRDVLTSIHCARCGGMASRLHCSASVVWFAKGDTD